MTVTDSPQTEVSYHPISDLLRAVHSIADRTLWHSEDQKQQVMDKLRSAEAAITDGHEGHVPVVPPAPTWPAPTSVADVATGMGLALDYDKLAAAIVKAQTAQAAAGEAPAPAVADPAADPTSGDASV